MIERARTISRLKLFGAAAFAISQYSSPAAAQTQASISSLTATSFMPAFDSAYLPTGIVVGSATLFPALSVATTYDDNIYNTDAKPITDEYFSIKPSARVFGNLGTTTYTVNGGGDIERFVNTTTEDTATYNVNVLTLTTFGADWNLRFNGSYGRQTEARGTAGDIFIGGDPIAYQLGSASATIMRSVGPLKLQLTGDMSNYDYDRAHFDGMSIDQSSRNFLSYNGQFRTDYMVGSEVSVYVSGSYDASKYTSEVSTGRDSHGFSLLGGVHLEATDLVLLDGGIGYIDESFSSKLFPGVKGLNYNLNLNWSITPLTTITATANRSIQRSPIVGVAGISEQVGTLSITHQLLRNLILNGKVGVLNDTYKGENISDTRVTASVDAKYALSRNMVLELNYGYREQSTSDLLGRRYSGNSVSLSLRLLR